MLVKHHFKHVLTCRAWKRDSVAKKSDFLRRNGAFVATRARVELVHARGNMSRARAARQLECAPCACAKG